MKKLNILFIGLTFLFISGCSQPDDDAVSEPELSGFQAIIDGEIVDFEYTSGAAMNTSGRHLSIPAIDSEGNQLTIFIGENDLSAPILTEGTYTANANNTVTFAIDPANTFPDTQLYIIGGNVGFGEIIIESLDTTANVVSIRFNGTAGDIDGNTLEFSDGIAENITFESF